MELKWMVLKEDKCLVFQKVSTIYGVQQRNILEEDLGHVRGIWIGKNGLEGRQMQIISKSVNHI